VIAVGSTNANDERSITFGSNMNAGSSYGAHISVVAPGNYIFGLHHLSNFDYNYYWCGTSQATPHVAGLAALLVAQNPARTPDQIKSIIESSAQDRVGTSSEDVQGWDKYYGHGRINAYRALLKTSLSQPPQSLQLSIYPNPNHGQFKILLNAEPFEIAVIIKNVLGQSVFYQKIAAGTEQVLIQLPDNANGIHLACFYRDGQLQNMQKMIVNL
jgi:subtilisin family serine protease